MVGQVLVYDGTGTEAVIGTTRLFDNRVVLDAILMLLYSFIVASILYSNVNTLL